MGRAQKLKIQRKIERIKKVEKRIKKRKLIFRIIIGIGLVILIGAFWYFEGQKIYSKFFGKNKNNQNQNIEKK